MKITLVLEYEKIKCKIDDYKEGKIKKRELTLQIFKALGKTIEKIFIKRT